MFDIFKYSGLKYQGLILIFGKKIEGYQRFNFFYIRNAVILRSKIKFEKWKVNFRNLPAGFTAKA